MKRLLLVFTVAALAFAAACGSTTTTSSTPPVTTNPTASSTQMPGTPVSVAGGGTYWDITPAQLAAMSKDFVLADTDTTYVGEIPSTDLFINSDNISQELSKFPADKTTKIVIYCTAGVKTQAVAVALVQAGYTRVMELLGGITAWQAAGYPTTFLTRTMA